MLHQTRLLTIQYYCTHSVSAAVGRRQLLKRLQIYSHPCIIVSALIFAEDLKPLNASGLCDACIWIISLLSITSNKLLIGAPSLFLFQIFKLFVSVFLIVFYLFRLSGIQSLAKRFHTFMFHLVISLFSRSLGKMHGQ